MIKVCIAKDDQGQFTVGTDENQAEANGPRMMAGGMPMDESKDAANMQPVADIEAALSTARDLLTSPQAQAADQGPPTGAQPDQIWNRAKADRQMAKQPGGPMMGKMG